MNVLYFMIPASLLLGAFFVALFWWALRGGQFDDFETAPLKAIIDDDQKSLVTNTDTKTVPVIKKE